jgi:prepilin-type N-terminal cleavage/methylation domain-containing protein
MKEPNKKIINKKLGPACRQAGMTYIELIVVLAIFSIMASVVLFNYRDFQARIEIKSLSNDIALKIVGAQKAAMSGLLAPLPQQKVQEEWGITNWKPSYGLYFGKVTPESFISFADLDNSAFLTNGDKPAYNINNSQCDGQECLDQIGINQNYQISDLHAFYQDCSGGSSGGTDTGGVTAVGTEATNPLDQYLQTQGDTGTKTVNTLEATVDTLSIDFTRPDSRAVIQTTPTIGCPISSASINLTSSNGTNKANIIIYASGRIELE